MGLNKEVVSPHFSLYLWTMAATSSSSTTTTTTTTNDLSFAQAFAAVAHHFFPDGCPRVELQDIWPCRNDRNPVAAADALPCIQQHLPQYVKQKQQQYGMTALEMEAVVVVALATLPVAKSSSTITTTTATTSRSLSSSSSSVGVGSPLVDGSSQHFRSLLRTLIPRRDSINDDSNTDHVPNSSITTTTTTTAAAAAAAASIIHKRILDSLVSQRARLDSPGRCVLLQWITLMIRYFYNNNNNLLLQAMMHKHIRRYEPIWIQFALTPDTCADAVRLLLHMTTTTTTAAAATTTAHSPTATSVSVYRAQQVRACWDAAQQQQQRKKDKSQAILQKRFRPLMALLQLYARLDPAKCDCYRIISSSNSSNTRDGGSSSSLHKTFLFAQEEWFSFPDPDWARTFQNHPLQQCNDENDDHVKRRPYKRAKASSSLSSATAAATAELDAFLVCLPQFLLPISSSTTTSTSLGILQPTISSVTEIHTLRHAILLSGYHHRHHHQPNMSTTTTIKSRRSHNSYHCWITQMRHNLPYLLYEEWYESSFFASSKSRSGSSSSSGGGHSYNYHDEFHQRAILQSLAVFVRHTGWLLPEMENFVLRHVLPVWSDDPIVLYDLIPAISPQRLNVGAFRSLIWQHLEPIFVYNSSSSSNESSLQYAIVAGALTGLLYRWGCYHPAAAAAAADEDSDIDQSKNNDNNIKLLQKLIPWTDELLTKGFLLASSNHELLSAAAYEFYSAVARVTDQRFLGAPDAALTYRMLLSSSAFSIDRICHLLVQYKKLFERLFQESTSEKNNDTLNERIDLFNSFVWDFGSVLWRCTPPPPPPPLLSDDMDDVHSNNDNNNRSILFTDLFLRPATQQRIHAAGAVVAPALSIWNRDVLVSYYTADMSKSDNSKVEYYLEYLRDECGLHGLHEFLHTFVGPLVQRQQDMMHE